MNMHEIVHVNGGRAQNCARIFTWKWTIKMKDIKNVLNDFNNDYSGIGINEMKDDTDYSSANGGRKTASRKNNNYDIKLFSNNFEFAYLNNSRVSKAIANREQEFNKMIDDYRHIACLRFLVSFGNQHNVICRKTARENMPLSRKEIEEIFEKSDFNMKKRAVSDFLNKMLNLNILAHVKATKNIKEQFIINPAYCNMGPAGKVSVSLFKYFHEYMKILFKPAQYLEIITELFKDEFRYYSKQGFDIVEEDTTENNIQKIKDGEVFVVEEEHREMTAKEFNVFAKRYDMSKILNVKLDKRIKSLFYNDSYAGLVGEHKNKEYVYCDLDDELDTKYDIFSVLARINGDTDMHNYRYYVEYLAQILNVTIKE